MLAFNLNDGGRKAAGRKGKTGDCLIRAIAIATGIPYETVYKRAASMYKQAGYTASGNVGTIRKSRKRGMRSINKVQDDIVESFGFTKEPQHTPRLTYSQAEMVYGDCMVTTTKHIACIRNGALQDTFDGRTYIHRETGQTIERKAMSIWTLTNPSECARV